MLLGTTVLYNAPDWLPRDQMVVPTHKVVLAHGNTPIQAVALPGLPESCPQIFLKRDDMTGSIETAGNKIRKLEFLLAEAKALGSDCVITAGGTQSNHCRATVAAARMVGLDAHLVLRDDFHEKNGNFFVNQLLGANILEVDRPTYTANGGFEFYLNQIKDSLVQKGKKPYVIPVGGSSRVGSYGYVECFREIAAQVPAIESAIGGAPFSDIVVTTGSGGTLAGLGLSAKFFNDSKRREMPFSVRAYCTSDTPEYFYHTVDKLVAQLFDKSSDASTNTASSPSLAPGDSREFVEVRSARGLGYSKCTVEELQFLNMVARQTGILFDRAYTNKAAFQMVKDLAGGSLVPKGKLMFIHTGGGPSAFDKPDQILNCIPFQEEPFSPQK